MAEIFGLVVGSLALPQIALQAQALVQVRQQKKRQVKRIQERLREFEGLVESIERGIADGSMNESLKDALLRGKSVVQQLNDAIEQWLIDRERTFFWSRYRRASKTVTVISRLGEELDMAQQRVRDAVPLQNNSEIREVRGAAARLATSLSLMTEQNVTLSSRRLELAAGRETKYIEASRDVVSALVMRDVEVHPDPTSVLESSPMFRPASYTGQDGVMDLFSICNREIASSDYSRINRCDLFYRKQHRTWKRISLTITTSVESIYWNLGKVTSAVPTMKGVSALPNELRARLEAFLNQREIVAQDDQLSIFLGKSSLSEQGLMPIDLRRRSTRSQSKHIAYLQQVTDSVKHWNIPWYWDSDLDHRPTHPSEPDTRFIAHISCQSQSRWLFELRFGSDKEQMETVFHNLKVLHFTTDVRGRAPPGINQLAGVVYDKESGLLTGVLSEIPEIGRLSNIITDADPPIPWSRRMKWCRQIVQGVAEMHRKQCFSGGLFTNPDWGSAIDGDDNVVLYRFWPMFFDGGSSPGVLPPEHRVVPPRAQGIQATASTDLYQLGLLLWRIAGGNQRNSRANFCEIAGCASVSDAECNEPHADPIQLPTVSADTPDILTAIISACRSEKPDSRPPACELLRWLEDAEHYQDPSSNGPEPQPHKATYSPQYLEELIAKFGPMTTCDLCRGNASARNFHCGICNLADFDLCEMCFSTKGLHCHDESHYMREFVCETHYSESTSAPRNGGRWYSSVNENGERHVILG